MNIKNSKLEQSMRNYLKTYEKINELKQEDNNECLYRLFFVNVLINKILFKKLEKATSKDDFKEIINYMKIETMIINDKLKTYKDDTYVLETVDEIKDILGLYCEGEYVEKIMKDLPSRYNKSKKRTNNIVQFPYSKKA